MDKDLFERLLYEEESTTLDCKKEQYHFVKATEEEKSELLKDVLGFANAWRRSEAYILIGVEEVRGGRSKVIGIPETDHLDDHSLQQFVNNLTNRPMRFHYEAFGVEGKQVGIIRIEIQARPIYLRRDYGKLEKERVFVRRGSSTDPSKPATLEEVAMMGQTAAPQAAELVVEFAHIEQDDSLGTHVSWDAEFCNMPSVREIPDLAPRRRGQAGFAIDILPADMDISNRPNRAYFRELAEFEFVRRLFRPVRLMIKNVGQVVATDVRFELEVPVGTGVHIIGKSDLPCAPRQKWSMFLNPPLANIKQALRRDPGDVAIDKNGDRYRIEIDCADLQPGRKVWSQVFYVGKRDTGAFSLAGMIYAANLPEPSSFTLTITATIGHRTMELDELQSLPEPPDEID